jgi:hypothetical protein
MRVGRAAGCLLAHPHVFPKDTKARTGQRGQGCRYGYWEGQEGPENCPEDAAQRLGTVDNVSLFFTQARALRTGRMWKSMTGQNSSTPLDR